MTTETKTLESQPKSNVVAVATPNTLDYDSIVREIAENKTRTGFSFTKGNGLFASSCGKVKSLLSLNQKDLLSKEIATAIQGACERLKTRALNAVNVNNIASTSSKVVLRNGLGHVKHVATGYDGLTPDEQILFSNLNINALNQKRDALVLKYEDTSKIDAMITKWRCNKFMAEEALKTLKEVK